MKRFRIASVIFFIFCICLAFTTDAQIKEVAIGVNGLTCSQCTRSVEMHIRKLSFVKNVEMNLEHTNGKIIFKDQKKVDLEKIAQAVSDAGFSLRSLEAQFSFDHVKVSSGYCYDYAGDKYEFVETPTRELTGDVTVKLIGEKFLPKKDFKKWEPGLKTSCTNATGKIYYVTM